MDEFDVVVLGTGAAGLTAAIRASAQGADVGLFEKADKIGGTAAWSWASTPCRRAPGPRRSRWLFCTAT